MVPITPIWIRSVILKPGCGDSEQDGLITIKYGSGEIRKLTANQECWDLYYKVLQEDKLSLQQDQIMLYQRYLGMSPLLDRFCQEQTGRLQQNKNPLYGGKEAEAILELCKFILQNRQDILERELSMAILKDSKRWEQKYRSKVCGLLRKYGDYESLFLGLTDDRDREDKRETERILLAEHQIYPNPSYVYFKGNAGILLFQRTVRQDRPVHAHGLFFGCTERPESAVYRG